MLIEIAHQDAYVIRISPPQMEVDLLEDSMVNVINVKTIEYQTYQTYQTYQMNQMNQMSREGIVAIDVG